MTETPEQTSTITCVCCAKSKETKVTKKAEARVPRGWKKLSAKAYCRDCKRATYALRAVCIPVAKCDWKVVGPVVREGMRESVRCSNWLLTMYYQSDTIASGGSEKLPDWSTPYLYPQARQMFPSIEPTSLVALINTVSSNYRAARFEMWRGTATLPVYRSAPLPINAQNWTLREENGNWVFSFRYSRERYELILRSGGQFHRQHRMLAMIAVGEMESGEAAVYQQGDALMLKVVGWVPRAATPSEERVVKARTCADGFLVAVDGKAIWRLNADHVQRRLVGAAAQQQRLREDLKAERRFPKQMRQGIIDRQGFLSARRQSVLASWTHEASHQLVQWAHRRHASQLVWDDSYPSNMASFPWFVFAAKIQQKCEILGIEFVRASEYVPQEAPGAVAS